MPLDGAGCMAWLGTIMSSVITNFPPSIDGSRAYPTMFSRKLVFTYQSHRPILPSLMLSVQRGIGRKLLIRMTGNIPRRRLCGEYLLGHRRAICNASSWFLTCPPRQRYIRSRPSVKLCALMILDRKLHQSWRTKHLLHATCSSSSISLDSLICKREKKAQSDCLSAAWKKRTPISNMTSLACTRVFLFLRFPS